eukprot:5531168-Pyramimonas_sp.AAC.1
MQERPVHERAKERFAHLCDTLCTWCACGVNMVQQWHNMVYKLAYIGVKVVQAWCESGVKCVYKWCTIMCMFRMLNPCPPGVLPGA